MELILFAFLVAAFLWFFPFILAFFAFLFCMVIALLCWIKNLLFPGDKQP